MYTDRLVRVMFCFTCYSLLSKYHVTLCQHIMIQRTILCVILDKSKFIRDMHPTAFILFLISYFESFTCTILTPILIKTGFN